jgi:hypothetical protein
MSTCSYSANSSYWSSSSQNRQATGSPNCDPFGRGAPGVGARPTQKMPGYSSLASPLPEPATNSAVASAETTWTGHFLLQFPPKHGIMSTLAKP